MGVPHDAAAENWFSRWNQGPKICQEQDNNNWDIG